MFMMVLFTLLWALLFVIPGIIALLRYSQAFFILVDDPAKGVMQCINESKQLMVGNKGTYFCLILTFIGWALLTGLAIGTVTSMVTFLGTGFIGMLFAWVVGLGMCWLTAYVFATTVAFYDILTGRLMRQPN